MDTSSELQAAAELGVCFDGREYHYKQYSYDRLADACAYAKHDRARSDFQEDALQRHWKQWPEPSAEDRVRMAVYGISYEKGRYVYRSYRYDTLACAFEYAAREAS